MRRGIGNLAAAIVIPAVSFGAIVVDGNEGDWTGTASAALHTVGVSGGEWIYKGEAGDLRAFGPVGARPNYDITELRVTRDTSNLYILVRLADVTDTNEPSVCLGVDLDRSAGDSSGLVFLGDDSGSAFAGGADVHPEYIVQIHNAQSGITWAEYYDDVNPPGWFTTVGESDTFISATNDLIEARLSLASLGLTPTSQFGISLVSFDNGTSVDPSGPGFNNDTDTTVDYPDQDALDGIGGTAGVSENAFTRVFGGASAYTATNIPVVNLTVLGAGAPVTDWSAMN